MRVGQHAPPTHAGVDFCRTCTTLMCKAIAPSAVVPILNPDLLFPTLTLSPPLNPAGGVDHVTAVAIVCFLTLT